MGIIRVSDVGDREGASFISPSAQRTRLDDKSDALDIDLVAVFEEINVSGGRPLKRRKGLVRGVEMIEAGEADVLMVGYFDRLVRELKVQWEVVSRVEAAGGEVVAVDFGRISEETAVQWLSATMVGAVHEYVRRSSREKTAEAKADAIRRGLPPFPRIPRGYTREIVDHDRKGNPRLGPFVEDPAVAPLIREAFEMRARRRPHREIADFLRSNGVPTTDNLMSMFESRVYLGELHYGELENLKAHKAIIPRDLFDRVQRVRAPKGRRAKSDFLLARLDVLRCDEGRRMVAGSTSLGKGRKLYPYYRCPPGAGCEHPMSIQASIVEPIVWGAVERALEGRKGRASVEDHAREAEEALRAVEEKISAAIRAFAGVEDVEATQEVLGALLTERTEKQAVVDQLGGAGDGVTLTAADRDTLTLEGQRDLVRAVVESVTISPGRGAERVAVKTFI